MQKLVTIYLDNIAYNEGSWIQMSYAERHGSVEEHLEEYLADGWRITNVNAAGGASEGAQARAWVVVVLEK